MSSPLAGLSAFPMIANRRRPGTVSRRIWRRFVARSVPWLDTPVMFEPGRARLATRPVATRSPGSAKTIGILFAACFAAQSALGPIRHDQIDLQPDELGCQLITALFATLCPAILDRYSMPLVPAESAEPLAEDDDPLARFRSRGRAQKADGRQFAGLLRACHERPRRRRAAEKRDELAPPQWIKLHSIPAQPRSDCRISNWRGSVRRQRSDFQLVGRWRGRPMSDWSMRATSRLKRVSPDGLGSDSRVVTLHRSTRHTNVARAPRV